MKFFNIWRKYVVFVELHYNADGTFTLNGIGFAASEAVQLTDISGTESGTLTVDKSITTKTKDKKTAGPENSPSPTAAPGQPTTAPRPGTG
ncbi:MAG: hypothetical protein J6N51_08950 [Selenomonas sp.]|nr:hypothetical protein [Selenomonas sp.]